MSRPGENAEEGKKLVEAAILAAIRIMRAARPNPERDGNIVEAVMTALEHEDYEDHENLQRMALRLFSHPEAGA